jgi:hypothetical protein
VHAALPPDPERATDSVLQTRYRAQPVKRLMFELTTALPAHAQPRTDFVMAMCSCVAQSVVADKDLAVLRGQETKHGEHLASLLTCDHTLGRVNGPAVGDEVPEGRGILANGLIQRRGDASGAAQ